MSHTRLIVATIVGSLIAVVGVVTVGLPYAVVTVGASGLAAGWIARRHGVVVGVAAVVLGALLWSIAVLGRAWFDGDLARTFPDCDPCGLRGYAARMLVLSAMGIAAFGPLAGICGWLGSVARARLLRA